MSTHRAETDTTTRAIHATTGLVLVLATVVAILWASGSASASQTTPARPAQVHAAKAAQPVQVTVVDRIAPGTWHGMDRAVAGWNASPLVHLTVADKCVPGTYCVFVDAYDHGSSNWQGLTTALSDHMAHTQVNLHYAGDVANQTATLCHEIGHALGVAHPDGGSHHGQVHGCITGSSNDMVTPTASPADLAALYGVGTQGWGALLAN